MQLLNLITQNQTIQVILLVVYILFISFCLGRIIQQKFRFNKSNTYTAVPIGIVTMLLLNQIVYTPLVLIGLNIDIISIINTIKSISLLLFIIISYEDWLPSTNMVGLKTIGYSLVSLAIVITIFMILTLYVDSFMIANDTWVNDIKNIGVNNVYEPAGKDPIVSASNNYKSTYYWMYIISSMMSGDMGVSITMSFGLIFIIGVSLTIQSSIINHERSFTSVFLATMISIMITIILGFIGASNDLFYTLSLSLIILLVIYSYANKEVPSDNAITIGLFATISFFSIGENSISYFTSFGLLLVGISIIKGGNIIRNTIHYLLIGIAIIVWYVPILFIYDTSLIKTVFMYLLFLIGLISLMLLPLFSLGYTQSRREELVNFEKTIKERIGIGSLVGSLGFMLMLIFINFLNGVSTFELAANFIAGIDLYQGRWYIGLTFYLCFILIPTIIIIIFWAYGKKNSLLSLFVLTNLFINPITISSLANLSGFSVSSEILIIIPTTILILWLLGEVVKRIPSLH